MALNVRFLKGTEEEYNALTTKDPNTFYYLSDVSQLYLGEIELSNTTAADADLTEVLERLASLEDTVEMLEFGNVIIVADEIEMLALTDINIGQQVLREDTNTLWIYKGDDPSDISCWAETGVSGAVVETAKEYTDTALTWNTIE